MELSNNVKEQLSHVVEVWAYEYLSGKPEILIYAVYSNLLELLTNKTIEINETFKGA